MWLLLKNALFTVAVPGMVAVYLPLRIAGSRGVSHTDWGWTQYAGSLVIGWGAAIYFWCLWDFARKGRGTPAPIDAPKQLVVSGPYRYVRNPMYLGVLLVVAGWGLWLRHWWIIGYGLAVWGMFHCFVVLLEEPLLRSKFDRQYSDYCHAVKRWLPARSPRKLAE